MVILAAHNTLSSYKALHWWLKPFTPLAKCQKLDIQGLYDNYVRMFDIRVRITKKHKVIVCHGLYDYDCDAEAVLQTLNLLSKKSDMIYVRLVNEDKFRKSNKKEFLKWCTNMQIQFGNIKYQIVSSKKKWEVIKNLDQFPAVFTHYCYWTKDKGRDTSCFIPEEYADVYNSNNIRVMNSEIAEAKFDKKTAKKVSSIWWFDFI